MLIDSREELALDPEILDYRFYHPIDARDFREVVFEVARLHIPGQRGCEEGRGIAQRETAPSGRCREAGLRPLHSRNARLSARPSFPRPAQPLYQPCNSLFILRYCAYTPAACILPSYSRSMTSAYFFSMTFRRGLSVGVRSPDSIVSSDPSSATFLTLSYRASSDVNLSTCL